MISIGSLDFEYEVTGRGRVWSRRREVDGTRILELCKESSFLERGVQLNFKNCFTPQATRYQSLDKHVESNDI